MTGEIIILFYYIHIKTNLFNTYKKITLYTYTYIKFQHSIKLTLFLHKTYFPYFQHKIKLKILWYAKTTIKKQN